MSNRTGKDCTFREPYEHLACKFSNVKLWLCNMWDIKESVLSNYSDSHGGPQLHMLGRVPAVLDPWETRQKRCIIWHAGARSRVGSSSTPLWIRRWVPANPQTTGAAGVYKFPSHYNINIIMKWSKMLPLIWNQNHNEIKLFEGVLT